ncbi:MAG TPA: ABC transporter permease [Gemmatirosa sp.]
MLGLALRRLLHAVATVLVAATVSFGLLHLAPGDPVSAMLDQPTISEATRAAIRARFGFDRPVPEQYARWIGAALHGDLGWSVSQQRPVVSALADALPRTALLIGSALALAFVAGIAIGAFAGWRPRHPLARALVGTSIVFHAAPEFVIGLALVAVVALRLAWLPSGGFADPVADSLFSTPERLVDRLRHLVLPATALALGWTAIIARHQRAAVGDAAKSEFVRTARAKGLGEERILVRHTLRAALAPTVALLGLALPALVGGAVVTESVFAWPGMGLLATQAVGTRDYALVTGAVVVGSAAVAAAGLVAELLQGWLDPRLGADAERTR